MDKIKIKVPSKKVYIKSMRLLSASLASDLGFDIEAVEDVRVLISEALNYKINEEDIEIEFLLEKSSLTIEVYGKDSEEDEEKLHMRNLIIESLADEIEVRRDYLKFVKRV